MIFDKNINIFFARDKFFITGIFLFIVNLRKNNIMKLQNKNLEVLPDSFWSTNFWLYWQTMFAFQQVTPALFGALCASYLAKHWRISILPIAVLVIVLLFNGTLGTGVLIPIGVVVSLVGAHLMYKKGMLK